MSAAKERELLALLDSTADDAHRGWLDALLHALSADPDAMTRAYEIYARLDELADAEATDPRVDVLARDVVAVLPEEALALMTGGPAAAGTAAAEDGDDGREAFAEVFFADFPRRRPRSCAGRWPCSKSGRAGPARRAGPGARTGGAGRVRRERAAPYGPLGPGLARTR